MTILNMGTSNEEQGTYEEFLELYSRDRDRLFAYVYGLLPHQADAEDVFQRSSLLLWKKFPDYDRQRPFLPWACSLAHYEVRNFVRSVNRDRLQFDEELTWALALSSTFRKPVKHRFKLSKAKPMC